MITIQDILEAQNEWGKTIVKIGKMRPKIEQCVDVVKESLSELYAFEKGDIAFKPTKASNSPFRPNMESALSYFIGNNQDFPEDKGFALEPWEKVSFNNEHIILEDNRAVAMGHYFFYQANGEKVKVEYTFSYVKIGNGELKIDVHHSSLPFSAN